MTELEALRHNVAYLEKSLIDQRDHNSAASLRDIEQLQWERANAARLRAALLGVCRQMLGAHCTPSRMRDADACWQEAGRALWPDA